MYLEKKIEEPLPIFRLDNPVPGIYFLLNNDDAVVYVGKSNNVHKRIHFHVGKKDFVKIAILPCDPSEHEKMEAKYIAKYQPKYNKSWPGGDCGFSTYKRGRRMKKKDIEKLKIEFLNDPDKCVIENKFLVKSNYVKN